MIGNMQKYMHNAKINSLQLRASMKTPNKSCRSALVQNNFNSLNYSALYKNRAY